jgi:branched-chain amino acid transport system ATP-binding protein
MNNGRGFGLFCDGVVVDFGGVRAIDGVDFALEEGEIVGLIGPNGAGKSTLINVISGFQPPTDGRVYLDRVDITKLKNHKRALAGVVRTFQSVRLFGGLSVLENLVAGGLGTPGSSVHEATRKALEVSTVLGLSRYLDKAAGALPHGVERLVGIGRALATRPRFLLLDEPAAGLNEAESDELGHLLVEVRDRYRCGICVVEHDMRLIMNLSQRIEVLDSGKTIAQGSPSEVRNNPLVVDAYLGRS